MFKYFVSYHYGIPNNTTGFGNIIITSENVISSIDEIIYIGHKIEKIRNHKEDSVVVLNYIPI